MSACAAPIPKPPPTRRWTLSWTVNGRASPPWSCAARRAPARPAWPSELRCRAPPICSSAAWSSPRPTSRLYDLDAPPGHNTPPDCPSTCSRKAAGLNLPDDLRREARLQDDPADRGPAAGTVDHHRQRGEVVVGRQRSIPVRHADRRRRHSRLPDYKYHLISNLAPRHALIGDPTVRSILFVSCEIERWRCDPSWPTGRSCPAALVKRHPAVLQLALPVSRRLNADTVNIIQPAFYPDMPFPAL